MSFPRPIWFLWGFMLATLMGLYWSSVQERRSQVLYDLMDARLIMASQELSEAHEQSRRVDVRMSDEEAVQLAVDLLAMVDEHRASEQVAMKGGE